MKRLLTLAALALLAVLHGCQRDMDEPINIPDIRDEVNPNATFATVGGTLQCPVATAKLELLVYTTATAANPAVHTVVLKADNSFEANIDGLVANTDYLYKYIVYSAVDRAELTPRKFRTKDGNSPLVKTGNAEFASRAVAVCGGEVTSDEGFAVTARGVCWNTQPKPTIADSHTTDGTGVGTFQSMMTKLDENTTYYVRAYATNKNGTNYGEQITVTTNEGLPVVTTHAPTDIVVNAASAGGYIISNSGYAITARGICYSTAENPTTDDSRIEVGNGVGRFYTRITGLSKNTTYYVRAYASNINGTVYGEQRTFTTQDYEQICGHDYVDLGLPSGLKWATHNIGADNPWDYGNYYAWGETSTKEFYRENNSRTFGNRAIEDISRIPDYDAAAANWKCTWRIPTKDEMIELVENCAFELTSVNGKNGALFTGSNGNTLFLPAAGGLEYGEPPCDGLRGYYWTSTVYHASTLEGRYSYTLFFHIDSNNPQAFLHIALRYLGIPIRPVSD